MFLFPKLSEASTCSLFIEIDQRNEIQNRMRLFLFSIGIFPPMQRWKLPYEHLPFPSQTTSLLHFLPSLKSHLGVKKTPTSTNLMLKPEVATSSQTYKIKLQVFPRKTWSAQESLQAASSQPRPWLKLPDAAGARLPVETWGESVGCCPLVEGSQMLEFLAFLVCFTHTEPPPQAWIVLPEPLLGGLKSAP